MSPCVNGIDLRRGIPSAFDVCAPLHEVGSGTLNVAALLSQYINWNLSSEISSTVSIVAQLSQRIHLEVYILFTFIPH
jgi:hypothetical protein